MAKAFAENGNFKVLLVDLNPALRGSNIAAASRGITRHGPWMSPNAERFRQSSKSLYFASAPTRRNGKGAQALASVAIA